MELVTTDAALALIASLPPEQAEAVMLRVVVGLDAGATGKILGRRAGAVRTAAYRGLKQLAARLAQQAPQRPPEPRRSTSWSTPVTTSAAAALKEMR
jgi:RNA polymerase sigma-70 factor (ECF subfamily)